MITNPLPSPRLQLRWRKPTAKELKRRSVGHMNVHRWTCDYEIVIPLGDHDCRRTKRKPELIVRLGRTFMSTGADTPPTDAPFRDGAHARWDSAALSGLPVFVIGADGVAREQPNKQAAA